VLREPLSKSLADPLKKTQTQRCAQSSRYNVRAVYASARRYIARLASEIFLSGLQNDVDKKSQKTPLREMQLARKRMKEV
jgi:phage-related protein